MQLQEYLDALAYETAFWAAGLDNANYPINQFGALSEDVSEKLRTMAIGVLLVEADTDLFYHNLIRSARARETFLLRCRDQDFKDFHLAVSRSAAFFDALAASDFDLALRISQLSPREWVPEGEYEDDYCFTQFFHLIIQHETQPEDIAALLRQFEKALQGAGNPKLELCRALTVRDQLAFDKTFDEYIADHDEHLREDAGRMEDTHVVAERQLFVEGLGVLRVAERLGLRTQPEYKYCPALARLPMTVPFPGK